VAIEFYVREVPGSAAPKAGNSRTTSASRLADILRVRNVWLSALIASLLLAFFADLFVFLPLLLVRELKLLPGDMSVVMAAVGAVTLFGGLAMPALSDRWGRKTVLVACAPLGVALPLACVYGADSFTGLVALCALASLVAALPFLAIAIVPAESAQPRDRGTVVGFVMGTAEIFGGFAAPAVTGVVADYTSLLAAPIIAGACAVTAALLSLCLEETAPRRLTTPSIDSCTPATALPD
jgi:predicted MFS family arabinose efflux permease